MKIAVCNVSGEDPVVDDETFLFAVDAVGIQLRRDFHPVWGGATRLAPIVGVSDFAPDIDAIGGEFDAMLYVGDLERIPGALGYHAANRDGVPFGVVSVPLPVGTKQAWTTILSHELLELVANPRINEFVQAPSKPGHAGLLYAREVCDAVQANEYLIRVKRNGVVRNVSVSAFVRPEYFVPDLDPTTTVFQAPPTPSFGVAPGGYASVLDVGANLAITRFANARAVALFDAKRRVGGSWRRVERCPAFRLARGWKAVRARAGGGRAANGTASARRGSNRRRSSRPA